MTPGHPSALRLRPFRPPGRPARVAADATASRVAPTATVVVTEIATSRPPAHAMTHRRRRARSPRLQLVPMTRALLRPATRPRMRLRLQPREIRFRMRAHLQPRRISLRMRASRPRARHPPLKLVALRPPPSRRAPMTALNASLPPAASRPFSPVAGRLSRSLRARGGENSPSYDLDSTLGQANEGACERWQHRT